MRKSRFTEEQIIAILRESEAGVETNELCRRMGSRDLLVVIGMGKLQPSEALAVAGLH